MKKIFIVMNKLNLGAGSTRVIMNRTNSLTQQGYDVTIITFYDKQKKEMEVREKLIQIGRLNKKVKIVNIYEYYQNKFNNLRNGRLQKKDYKREFKLQEKGYAIKTSKKKQFAVYFQNGTYIKRKKWDGNFLEYIDYFTDNKKKYLRKIFHPDGFEHKNELYDRATEECVYIKYFSRDGFCYLAKDKKKGELYLFEKNSTKVKSFKSDEAFFSHWLNLFCEEQSEKPIIINDKKECAPRVLNMKKDKAHRIYVIHRNHFESPFVYGSPKRKQEEKILKRLPELDCLVVLTEKQRKDIIKEYGDYGNIKVIPNSIGSITKEKVKKETNLVSMMARLAPIKQIDQSIEAFQKVVERIPDAKYEIHGTGKLKEELQKKINNLGLENNVFLKGYANNTNKVYKRSLMTILTTKSEAFALVILESMANGTPVISYDVNYGPSDMITNEEDGYLIESSKKVLTDRMLELLENPDKANEMGKRAKVNAYSKFSDEKVTKQWTQLFKEIKNS